MKNLVTKVFFVLVLFVLSSNVVFADGAPSYNENMYSVVVNNKEGATLYYAQYNGRLEVHKTVDYGTVLVANGSYDISGETYLDIGEGESGIIIASADVEIYGEPVSPSDLRIR